jgi:hypothetical protein
VQFPQGGINEETIEPVRELQEVGRPDVSACSRTSNWLH